MYARGCVTTGKVHCIRTVQYGCSKRQAVPYGLISFCGCLYNEQIVLLLEKVL